MKIRPHRQGRLCHRGYFLIRLLAIPLVLSGLILNSATALAHEQRALGNYRLTVGFIVEPPIEGQKNGVDLRVADSQTQKAIEGVEESLQVEITHVPTGASKVFKLRSIFRDPGHYTADLLPTAPGHYRFRFFGAIEGTSVNETFNSRSGGGGFNDVEPAASIQFPVRLAELREIQGAVRGAQEAAQSAEASAAFARFLGFAGIGFGMGGLLTAGAVALVAVRRR
ncbi:MAG: hypothetical protein HY673_00720 [Chloroflexi bacterium]|nr:hypothetical protein [Chloroflexota bacterium]